jgi:hypothetical protein
MDYKRMKQVIKECQSIPAPPTHSLVEQPSEPLLSAAESGVADMFGRVFDEEMAAAEDFCRRKLREIQSTFELLLVGYLSLSLGECTFDVSV